MNTPNGLLNTVTNNMANTQQTQGLPLVEAITASLHALNVKNPENWLKNFPFDIYNNGDQLKCRIIINEQWRRIVTWVDRNTDFNSFDARLCLLPYPETDDQRWLNHFNQRVGPFVRTHDILSKDW